MREVFKKWYFYVIYFVMIMIGIYIIQFMLDIPKDFPEATAFEVLVWWTAGALAVVGLLFTAILSLSYYQSKENSKQLFTLKIKMDELISNIQDNSKEDLKLRESHYALLRAHEETKEAVERNKRLLKSHERRMRAFEKHKKLVEDKLKLPKK